MAAVDRRATDLSQSSVPIKMVVAITATALAVGGFFWTTTYGLRSDNAATAATLQIVLTKIDAAADMSRVREENTKAQMDSMKKELDSLRGKSDLLQLQFQQLQLKLEGKR
jgi:hypothetical protein